jgi:hypothetical protein
VRTAISVAALLAALSAAEARVVGVGERFIYSGFSDCCAQGGDNLGVGLRLSVTLTLPLTAYPAGNLPGEIDVTSPYGFTAKNGQGQTITKSTPGSTFELKAFLSNGAIQWQDGWFWKATNGPIVIQSSYSGSMLGGPTEDLTNNPPGMAYNINNPGLWRDPVVRLSSVPEASTWVMMILGFSGLVIAAGMPRRILSRR